MSTPARTLMMRGRLALAFQEVLTTIGRLRDGRQVPNDVAIFRAHVKSLLASADEEARRIGYPAEFVKTSVYSTVAFLDESMLSTPGALASAWAGRPLQDEIFGDNVAGEAFFQQLQDLLARQDSPYVADVLEVKLLCLYLGFRGRYSASEAAEVQNFMRAAKDKILRIRGATPPLSPQALPPDDEVIERSKDPVQRRLTLATASAAVAVAVAIVLVRLVSLNPGVRDIRTLVADLGL